MQGSFKEKQWGEGCILVVRVGASPHHCDGVWLICLIACERQWCLEPDLHFAAPRAPFGSRLALPPTMVAIVQTHLNTAL